MVISSNVVLSLGMVGALSIVRFRAAIKDPMDIVFLFWSIAMGIIIGARQYMFGVIAAVVAAIAFFIMLKLRGRREIYSLYCTALKTPFSLKWAGCFPRLTERCAIRAFRAVLQS